MKPIALTTNEKELALRALFTIGTVDHALAPKERDLLVAAAEGLGVDCDVDALEAVTPEAIAALGLSEEKRLRLVQALIVMALFDAEVTRAELKALEHWSKVLEIDEPRLGTLARWSQGLTSLTGIDLGFRSAMISRIARDTWKREGLDGLRHLYGSFLGVGAKDATLAERFHALGSLPEGTLGRVYHQHITSHGFNFPGDAGIVMPKQFVAHDLSHILAGYETDASGETEVIAFVAGFIGSDPFWYLFAILMHMHLGTRVFGLDPTAKLAADPAKMVKALQRGMKVNRDLYHDWDYWPDFARPLEEVRARFGVV